MRRAIDETDRRRARQVAFNTEQGITPRSVTKQVRELIDGVVDAQSDKAKLKSDRADANVEAMSEKDVGKRIKALERQMLEHARNLEFEQAARVRDQLGVLREQVFGASPSEGDRLQGAPGRGTA
jgi:excinuclease ABC subunit B